MDGGRPPIIADCILTDIVGKGDVVMLVEVEAEVSPFYDAVEIRLKEDHVGDDSIMHSVSLLHPLLKDAMREAASAQHA